jgi:hypothetical protein
MSETKSDQSQQPDIPPIYGWEWQKRIGEESKRTGYIHSGNLEIILALQMQYIPILRYLYEKFDGSNSLGVLPDFTAFGTCVKFWNYFLASLAPSSSQRPWFKDHGSSPVPFPPLYLYNDQTKQYEKQTGMDRVKAGSDAFVKLEDLKAFLEGLEIPLPYPIFEDPPNPSEIKPIICIRPEDPVQEERPYPSYEEQIRRYKCWLEECGGAIESDEPDQLRQLRQNRKISHDPIETALNKGYLPLKDLAYILAEKVSKENLERHWREIRTLGGNLFAAPPLPLEVTLYKFLIWGCLLEKASQTTGQDSSRLPVYKVTEDPVELTSFDFNPQIDSALLKLTDVKEYFNRRNLPLVESLFPDEKGQGQEDVRILNLNEAQGASVEPPKSTSEPALLQNDEESKQPGPTSELSGEIQGKRQGLEQRGYESVTQMAELGRKFKEGPMHNRKDKLTKAMVEAFNLWMEEEKTYPTARQVWSRIESLILDGKIKRSILEIDSEEDKYYLNGSDKGSTFHSFETRIGKLRRKGLLPSKPAKKSPRHSS